MCHAGNLSSLADSASTSYKGRAVASAIADKSDMEMTGWRDRLQAAIEGAGMSMRSVSIKSGAGEGYVHSILKAGKDPTIERLAAVCAAVPVSLSHVLYGVDITPEDEEVIRAIQESPEKRDAVLTLLRDRARSS